MSIQDDSIEAKPIKYNGCACPFHPLQIASYVFCLFCYYDFYFIDYIALSPLPGLRYFSLVFYSLLVISIIIIGLIATIIDPTDPTVHSENELIKQRYYLFGSALSQ